METTDTQDIVTNYEDGSKLVIEADGTRVFTASDRSVKTFNNEFKYDVHETSLEYNRETDSTFRYAIRFSEPMNKTFAERASNYVLKGDAGELLQVDKATLLSDEQTLILDLSVKTKDGNRGYEEYSLIHGQKLDIHFKNIVDKSGLALGGKYIENADGTVQTDLPKHENDPLDGRNDIQFEYVDKIKPKLKSIYAFKVDHTKEIKAFEKGTNIDITNNLNHTNWDNVYFKLEDSKITLELTFTEPIKNLSDNNLRLKLEQVNPNGPAEIESVSAVTDDPGKVRVTLKPKTYVDNISNWEEIRLLLNTGDSNKYLQDINGNNVSFIGDSISSAYYKFRALPISFYSAVLSKTQGSGFVTYPGDRAESSILDASIQAKYYTLPDSNETITFYYAVNSERTVTDYNMIKNPKLTGTATIFDNEVLDNISRIYQLRSDSGSKFQANLYIHIFAEDVFGNLSLIKSQEIELPELP